MATHDPFYDLFDRPTHVAWERGHAAVITVDLQRLDAHREGWLGRLAKARGKADRLEERFALIDGILPRVRAIQDAFRQAGEEVIHVRVAYRTKDGRDAPRAHMPHPTSVSVPIDADDADLLPEVGAVGDELVFSKTSASVFSSTDIDYVLRSMEISHLIFTGIVTEGCVELSARDAADRGYDVTLIEDACTSSTRSAHEDAVSRMRDAGFIDIMSAVEVVQRVSRPARVV